MSRHDGKTKAQLLQEIEALEQRLEAAEGRHALDRAPLPYHSLAPDGTILFANHAWLSMLGFSVHEVVGKSLTEFLSPDVRERFAAGFGRFLKAGTIDDLPLAYTSRSGKRIEACGNGRVEYDAKGAPMRTHCISRDVTASLRAEQQLKVSEDRFRNLFDSSLDGIYYADLDGMIREVNTAFCAMLGWKETELVGRDILEITPRQWHEREREVFGQQAASAEQGEAFRKEFFQAHGGVTPVSVKMWADLDEEKRPRGVWGVVRDKSQTVRTQEVLKQRETQYQRFVETANEGIIGLDVGYNITYLNDIMADFLDMDKKDLLGTNFESLLEGGQGHREACFAGVEQGNPMRGECRFIKQDGSSVWGLISAAPIISAEGDYLGAFAMVADITERKRAEEVLKVTQFSVDNAPVDIYWLSRDGRLVYANDSACRSHGYSREEMAAVHIYDLNPQFSKEDWLAHWEVRRQTAFSRFESVHQRKDGTLFPVSIISHYKEYDGNEYLFTFSYDLTERQAAEDALRRSQVLLNTVERMSGTGGWEVDLQTGDMVMTKGLRALFGIEDAKDTVSALDTFIKLVHPDDRSMVAATMAAAMKERKNVEVEYRVGLKDGQEAILLTKAVVNGQGGDMRLYGSTHDVTKERHAAQELRLAHKRLLSILDSIDADVYVSELDGSRILFMNAHMQRHFGLPKRNTSCHEAFRGEPKPCLHCPKPDLLNASGIPVGTIVSERKNPLTGRWYLNHDRAIRWLEGELAHMHMAADITNLKEMESELKRAMVSAEAANVAKNEFLANMSHEIRTPLNGLLGMLQLLELSNLADDQRDYLQTAVNSGRSLLKILNDILDLSKVESGMLEIREQETDLPDVLESVVAVFRYQAESRDVEVSWHMNADGYTPFMIDKGRLRQILFNLVGNGVKFTESGAVSILAHPLGHKLPDGRQILYFAVSDTGIGIPDDMINVAFDPFTQVDGSTTRKYQGSGLGLGIVRRLVTLMGGTIAVSSEVGKGTTVHFTIAASPVEVPRASEIGRGLTTGTRSLNILVVEDEQVNRMVVDKLLTKLGHTVTCTENGARALERLAEQSYDCVLMDIQMPVMGGVEAARAIRKDMGLDLPIIALTAHAMKGDRSRFLDAGMDGYVSKPFDMIELNEALEDLIARGRFDSGPG